MEPPLGQTVEPGGGSPRPGHRHHQEGEREECRDHSAPQTDTQLSLVFLYSGRWKRGEILYAPDTTTFKLLQINIF